MRLASLIAVVVVALCSTGISADGFKMPATQTHTLSSEVLGETFDVVVALPFSYGQTTTNYPLLITLDGDAMFGMSAEIPRLLSFEGKVPPMIAASVVYGDFRRWIASRQRDFHSADDGAARFLETLKREIMPILKSNYRIDENAVAIYGHSSGGLFALYAGIQDPSLFSHILATSPSLEEEPGWAASFPDIIKARQHVFPRFFISVDASEQAMIQALEPSIQALRSRMTDGSLTYKVYDEGGHMAVIPRAYTAGLHFLFAKP